MTYLEALNHYTNLNALRDKKLPTKLSIAVVRNVKILTPIFDVIRDKEAELVRTYGKKDENGEPIVKDSIVIFENDETAASYKKEHAALFSMDENVDFVKVDIDELDYDSDKYDVLTIEEMSTLLFMINE